MPMQHIRESLAGRALFSSSGLGSPFAICLDTVRRLLNLSSGGMQKGQGITLERVSLALIGVGVDSILGSRQRLTLIGEVIHRTLAATQAWVRGDCVVNPFLGLLYG